MKIILIGHNEPGKTPYLFLKPDSALEKNNKPFFIPDFSTSTTVSLHPVIRISRLGKNIAERFANRYYDAVTAGLDITATNIQQSLSKEGLPWEESNSFDGSAVIGSFITLDKLQSISDLHWSLHMDEHKVQEGCIGQLLLQADQIVAWVSRYYTMKTGDLIYMGSFGRTAVNIGNRLQAYAGEDKVFDFHVR